MRTISTFIGENRRTVVPMMGHMMCHKRVTAHAMREIGHDPRRRAVGVVKVHSSACASVTRVTHVP